MSNQQIHAAKYIIAGLNFLVREAEDNDLPRVGRIINICLRDVCISLEFPAVDQEKISTSINTELYAAIRFLSRYASIKDQELKEELLAELEKLTPVSIPRGG